MQVSIVVPVFNRAQLILETLNSILGQTYRPLEVIVVDDGSTDNSLDVVRQWRIANQAPGFVVKVLSQLNQGAPVARNEGLATASSDIVGFLDSDDLYHPQFVEMLLRGFKKNPEVDVVTCEIQNFDHAPRKLSTYGFNDLRWAGNSLVFGKEYWATPNALYNRNYLVASGGWNTVLRYGWQDRELCLRLQLLGVLFIRSNLPLVWCRTNSEGKISDIARSKDVRFFWGIASAARALTILALRKGCLKEAWWLMSRSIKWAATAYFCRFRQFVNVHPKRS